MTAAIDRLRRGDLESLTELIPLYQERLYRYLIRLVRQQSVAEDLFQETWLKAVKSIRRYDPERPFDGWLFSIAHNLAIDFFRRRRPEALVETPQKSLERAVDALDQLLDSERGAATLEAVGELTALYREVVTLRFEEEMELEEIAAITGAPLGTVKTRLRRALETLRHSFRRRGLHEASR